MASRGAFGFRSAKQPEKDKKDKAPVGLLSRRSSITSSTSITSKLPTQSTSFFARSRKAKPESSSNNAASAEMFISTDQKLADTGAARSESGKATEAEPSGSIGLGSLTGSTTVQTTKSGKRRNVLRRKAPSVERCSGYARTESSASSCEQTPSRQYLEAQRASEPKSILGVTAPQVSNTAASYLPSGLGLGSEYATSSSHMATYNKRKNPQSSSTPTLPPPTPTYGQDSGSSTRRSESPGAFSRTSTPTSMSSQSPGVPTPAKAPLRSRTASPSRSRPPVTRNRFAERLLHREDHTSRSTGLTAVRESGTSSSSSSTMKPESKSGSNRPPHTDLPSPRPISPPSRSSSRGIVAPQSREFPRRQDSLNARPRHRQREAIHVTEPPPETRRGQINTPEPIRSRVPPPRPSREGVPQLDVSIVSPPEHSSVLQPSAQITEGKGRGSFDTDRSYSEGGLGRARSARTGLGRSPSNTSSAQPSRFPSPNPVLAQPIQLAQTASSRSRPLPSLETSVGTTRSAKDPSPHNAGSTKSTSRFGFFTRRVRSPEEPEKLVKKGPAAGTGHEGYGKYARRGRSGSVATSASRGRSTSSTSIGRTPSSRKSSLTSRDESELDDFYRDRLTPKAITGGGQAPEGPGPGLDSYISRNAPGSVSTWESNGQGNPSLQAHIPRLEASSNAVGTGHNLRHVNRRLPHREGEHLKAMRQPQDQFGQPYEVPNLATRRSLHRSQLFQGADPLRIPAPIDIEAAAPSPFDTLQSSIPQTDSTIPLTDDISEGHEGNWLKSKGSEKPRKSPIKWNFFQRAQASPKTPPVPTGPRSDDDQAIIRQLPATVSRMPESRPVPFYALIDTSEQEDTVQAPLGQITRSDSRVDKISSMSAATSGDASPVNTHNKLSMLLPSPPTLTSEFPKPPTSPPSSQLPPDSVIITAEAAPASTLPEPRKPRLQQVGRIPRVVSKRDRPHRPPPESFSRPRPYMPRHEAPTSLAPSSSEKLDLAAVEMPAPRVQTDGVPQKLRESQEFGKPASARVRLSDRSEQDGKKDEFLAFPPRVGSEVSGSSSSGILSFATSTAVVPAPGTAPDEDEVWNEYNEFLDTVESPDPLVHANTNPMDKEKQKRRYQPVPLHIRKGSFMSGSKSSSPQKKPASVSTYPPAAAAPSRGLPTPPRKSKFMDLPSTPGTISDLIAGYGDRSRDSEVSKRGGRSVRSSYSSSSIESEADSLAGREARGLQPTSGPSEVTATQRLSEIYLRRDALLASRWLSFDRVLFSPAHFQIQSNSKDRVLVLDGLGNDEWSYYCAENYPEAMVYTLSLTKRTDDAPAVGIPGVPAPPENHKHIHYSSLGRPFPFPQGFFTAAVFRFPTATSDSAYFNAISEFKRVLRSGGYLELSMLDIDMVNMGNLTRRALRGLKERQHMADPDVSLTPLSDNIQKMLGKKGFENLNRCTLDVPVAGQVNDSRAGSFDEHSRDPPNTQHRGRASDGIAKNLAKVGRWWFSHCYEAGSESRSIWNDDGLLAECEARETGFKLLLCYAQKPNQKRRTRSF